MTWTNNGNNMLLLPELCLFDHECNHENCPFQICCADYIFWAPAAETAYGRLSFVTLNKMLLLCFLQPPSSQLSHSESGASFHQTKPGTSFFMNSSIGRFYDFDSYFITSIYINSVGDCESSLGWLRPSLLAKSTTETGSIQPLVSPSLTGLEIKRFFAFFSHVVLSFSYQSSLAQLINHECNLENLQFQVCCSDQICLLSRLRKLPILFCQACLLSPPHTHRMNSPTKKMSNQPISSPTLSQAVVSNFGRPPLLKSLMISLTVLFLLLTRAVKLISFDHFCNSTAIICRCCCRTFCLFSSL